MLPLPNTPGGQYNRFTRIARDLARLPVELIEPVLAPLTLEAVARLALHDAALAPSNLTWAIEHSPTWSPWFAHHRATLAALVAATDQLAALCLPPAGGKDERDRALCTPFLQAHADPLRRGTYAGALWGRGALGDGAVLTALWARACRAEVRVVAGWVAVEEQARFAAFLGGDADTYLGLLEALRGSGGGEGVAIEDVGRFVGLLHRAREARAAALAGQLRRLAGLYERHPTRVKQPFAPQTRRLNEGHVLEKMRVDLKRMEGWFPLHYQKRPAWHRFRHRFPNLVPYDWCLRLFVSVLDEHPLSEQGGTTVYPAGFVAAIRKAIEGFPYFYDVSGETMDPKLVESLRTANTRWSADLQHFPAISISELPQVDDAKPGFLTKWVGRNYLPHSDAEINWLEAFIEIVAWMEQRFPEFVSEVRGKDWDEGNAEERKKRKGRQNAGTETKKDFT